ncbi:MAG: hypothetical protein ABW137_30210 [Mycobacterium sp.]
MTADTSRVVVVRAWLDTHRIIVRVLAGASHSKPTDEWVFADIDEACGQVADVLRELVADQRRSANPGPSATWIQTIDASAHPDPRQ